MTTEEQLTEWYVEAIRFATNNALTECATQAREIAHLFRDVRGDVAVNWLANSLDEKAALFPLALDHALEQDD